MREFHGLHSLSSSGPALARDIPHQLLQCSRQRLFPQPLLNLPSAFPTVTPRPLSTTSPCSWSTRSRTSTQVSLIRSSQVASHASWIASTCFLDSPYV